MKSLLVELSCTRWTCSSLDRYELHPKSPIFQISNEFEDTYLSTLFLESYNWNLTLFAEFSERISWFRHNVTMSLSIKDEFLKKYGYLPSIFLPSRATSAKFSVEMIYHPDPCFLHQAWAYIDPVVLIPMFAKALSYYNEELI